MNAVEKVAFPKVRLLVEMYTKDEMNETLESEIKRLAGNFVQKIQVITSAG